MHQMRATLKGVSQKIQAHMLSCMSKFIPCCNSNSSSNSSTYQDDGGGMAAAIHELKLPAVLATAEDHKRFIATHHPGCYVIYHYGQADMRHLFKALRLDDDETTAATCGNTRYVNLKAVEMDSLQIDNGSGLSYIYYRNGKACYLYTTAAHALK